MSASRFRPMLPPKEGYVEVNYNGQRVYKRVVDSRLFYVTMEPVADYTPSELRELCYETLKCIAYNGSKLTVDEAEKLFWQYYPENQVDICAELRQKIAKAKNDIREMYPDANEET